MIQRIRWAMAQVVGACLPPQAGRTKLQDPAGFLSDEASFRCSCAGLKDLNAENTHDTRSNPASPGPTLPVTSFSLIGQLAGSFASQHRRKRRCARCHTVACPPSDPHAPITADSDRTKHEWWCPLCKNLCGLEPEEKKLRLETYQLSKEVLEAKVTTLQQQRDRARAERDQLEKDRGDWVPGMKCSTCGGTGEDNEARACKSCGGDGGVWMTWKERFMVEARQSAELERELKVLRRVTIPRLDHRIAKLRNRLVELKGKNARLRRLLDSNPDRQCLLALKRECEAAVTYYESAKGEDQDAQAVFDTIASVNRGIAEAIGITLAKPEEEGPETIHACPLKGSGITPCCGKTPFELPPSDRLTTHQELVTCAALAKTGGGE